MLHFALADEPLPTNSFELRSIAAAAAVEI